MVENEKEETSETIVDKAEKIAERIESANIKAEEIYARNQAFEARQIMGGKSAAGKTPEPKKEITPKEYAAAALKGIILK